jgi:RHS repeat-associated protein
VYDGVNPYADFDGSGSLTMRYLADPNQPDALFARVAANGTAAWYLRDNINSVRQVVGPTGTVLDAITYDSFGNVLSETNPSAGDRFKYTGREYDAELGVYYYRARYYDPATGRFLGEDPKGFGAGDSNLYRYVGNQPTGRIDPMGLDWSDWVVSRMPDSWVNYLGSSRSNWIGHASNISAGYADALSFGLTSYARRGLGWDNVDYNSWYYTGGQIGGSIHSFALGYGAAGRVPQAGIWAYRGAQGYTVAGSVYGVGHSSYVLITDPQNFGFTDALGFLPLGGYVTSAAMRPLVYTRFYRGSTHYDVAETVQNQAVNIERLMARQSNATLDLGPGLYLTRSRETAQTFAELQGINGRQGGPAVLGAEISRYRWWLLQRQHGATGNSPISNMPGHFQDHVPTDAIEYFNRYAYFWQQGL